jgi:hypothetical protein
MLSSLLLAGAIGISLGDALPTSHPPAAPVLSAAAPTVDVTLRSQTMSSTGRKRWVVHEDRANWNASETAFCIVDMWDSHHCPSAVERIKPLAVMMNRTIAMARERGVSIIFAPSGCSQSYTSHPARKYVLNLPNHPKPNPKNHSQPPFPIASGDGGCDVQDGSAPDVRRSVILESRFFARSCACHFLSLFSAGCA